MIPRLEISFPLRLQKAYMTGKPYVPEEGEFLLNHSRSGICLALRAAGLPESSGVGVMVYNCHTVMNAVIQAGFEPVFLDVTEGLTLDLDDLRRKADRISALVVTHLFGIVNDVKRIKEICPHLVIIEDCAHAYGIGSLYGDFATFSIGQGKFPSVGDGGILRVVNLQYREQVHKLYESLPEYSWGQRVKLFMDLCLKAWANSPFIYRYLTLPIKKRRRIPQVKQTVVLRKMCRGIRAAYALEMKTIDAKKAIRKKNVEALEAKLPVGVSKYLVGTNAFMFVLFCENPRQAKESYYRRGLDSETHFAQALRWAEEFGYRRGDCPRAEQIVPYLLMVPTYFDAR